MFPVIGSRSESEKPSTSSIWYELRTYRWGRCTWPPKRVKGRSFGDSFFFRADLFVFLGTKKQIECWKGGRVEGWKGVGWEWCAATVTASTGEKLLPLYTVSSHGTAAGHPNTTQRKRRRKRRQRRPKSNHQQLNGLKSRKLQCQSRQWACFFLRVSSVLTANEHSWQVLTLLSLIFSVRPWICRKSLLIFPDSFLFPQTLLWTMDWRSRWQVATLVVVFPAKWASPGATHAWRMEIRQADRVSCDFSSWSFLLGLFLLVKSKGFFEQAWWTRGSCWLGDKIFRFHCNGCSVDCKHQCNARLLGINGVHHRYVG